ncbi:MAG TPA: hypothetical protein GXZ26_02385 [Firmicutes bacterium]|nr:hypothetical protein [Bacillota bacterium]
MTEKPYCTCCGRFITGGGLRVYATLICRSCEARIARLKVDDPDYTYWLRVIHSLWDRWEQKINEPPQPTT